MAGIFGKNIIKYVGMIYVGCIILHQNDAS